MWGYLGCRVSKNLGPLYRGIQGVMWGCLGFRVSQHQGYLSGVPIIGIIMFWGLEGFA